MKRFKFIYFGQLLIASSDYIFLCSTFCLVKLPLTFPRYKQFGTKLSPLFGLAKSSKYKTNFKLSQIPKLLVACVSRCFFIYHCFESSFITFFPFSFSGFSSIDFLYILIASSFLFIFNRTSP